MAQVFRYQVWDQMSGASIVAPRPATREFIEDVAHGVTVGDAISVDDRLLTDNGQVVQDFTADEARLLKELIERGGKASITAPADRSAMSRIVANRLVSSTTVGLARVDYEITPLGRLAVAQLVP